MKVIIAGGRDYQMRYRDWKILERYVPVGYNGDEIVSGCATGADEAGEEFADYHGIEISRFPADWRGLGKKAGPIRNEQMAKYADAVILFPGGTGTANMRKLAKQYGLKILYDAENEDADK